ncbi:Glutamine cyclotransferase [Lishizhenia tianjinensis]|uniref:Glutamine cyclotransferase n=1 Tax=Lishizhenia tianjinensis TaxID=477690 RepID=A0A1I7BF84_9FLAO|nr:glutaminyl-peptide cyclotransferase [Lishizhenia tianjinensis]SFT85840.1 Glutamine cyclotransferase [Lishizhenia tianjinensis]
MKILKPILAFLTVGLFFVGCENDKASKSEYRPLFEAKFKSPNNNVYYNAGMPIPVQLEFDSTKIERFTLWLNDSVIAQTNFGGRVFEKVVQSKSLAFGSYQFRLEAKLKEGKLVKDTRNIRVLSKTEPERWEAVVEKAMPHNTTSYTQGLEFYKGELYEGTGQYGRSKLLKVLKEKGSTLKEVSLDNQYFGEGITILEDKIYQLTWKAKTCFVYDVNTFEEIKRLAYPTEGWGLCNNGEQIIMSDGSHKIYFRNPETFAVEREIEVYTNRGPVGNLNELEYINGKIYANVYTSNRLVVIDPNTGNVESVIDCDLLALDHRGSGEVLNGIAYNPVSQKVYLTGKEWPELLEVSFKK